MAAFKATKNRSDSAGKFKATKQRSYDSAMVSAWETKNKEAYDTLEKYRQRINSGGYLSAEDLSSYRTALDNYVEASTGLRGISKAFGQGEMDDDNKWAETISQMETGYKGISDYYSQWKTEDAYNSWVKAVKEQEQMKTVDLNALSAELEGLKKQREERDKIQRELSRRQGLAGGYSAIGQYYATEDGQKQIAELERQLAAYGGLDDSLAQKEKYFRDASRLQNGIRLASAVTNDDFQQYADIGAAIENPTIPKNFQSRNPADWQKFEDEAYKSGNAVAWEQGNMGGDTHAYDFMTPQEVSIYNYYLGKGDRESADLYLDSIALDLNTRRANETFSGLEGKPLLEILYGVEVGFDQFSSGLIGLGDIISGKHTYKDPTHTQITAGLVREDLDDVGFDILGNSLGQIAFDFTTTTANMAPSVLASTAVGLINPVAGAVTGNALLGASAAGNAYQEVINMGYDASQAGTYGLAVGISEALLESALGGISSLGGTSAKIAKAVGGIDNALLKFSLKYGGKIGSEALEEGLQEVLDPLFKNAILNTDESINWSDVAYSALLGGMMGGTFGAVDMITERNQANAETKAIYGEDAQALVTEAMEINPDNTFAQKMQGRLDAGKNLSGSQLNRLVKQNEAAMKAQDMASIQTATETRLTELGETEDVASVAAALTKQAAGKKLSRAEQQTIANSKYGQRVANELNTDNINSGDYSSAWAEQLDTNRINAQEYSRLVEAAQLPQEGAEIAGGQVATQTQNTAQAQQAKPVEKPTATIRENRTVPANDQQMTGKLTGKESLQVAEESSEVEEPVTLESASQKYGAQAKAMIHTYQSGQDVAKYDRGYQVAYDMGKSGVAFSYIEKSPAVSYLTDSQKQLAYEAGQAASNTEAQALDTKNKAAANGKTGRKKGVVRGEGVTISDLKKTFNDTQGKAYKYLTTVAEVTGIDIVLYASEAGADGKFQGAQGRYSRSEPGTIYIDLNAGLSDINSADDLAKYAMLRTFAHEFTHFIENWNPIQYNELRKVVFDTLTQRGENVHDLIEDKQARNPDMSYDKASREVVAEAMTDILPDANFVQELAENHKTIFQKLLEQLKEFVQNLKDYFNSLGMNPSREAKALKEQVGETVKYLDSIVQLFDKVAVQAVENYQKTVATEEVKTERNAVTDNEKAAILAYKSGGSYLLNTKLRENISLTEQEQFIVDGLDSALGKLPIHKGKVYRNILFDDFGGQEARDAFVAGHPVGDLVSYAAYTSASTEEDGYTVEGDFAVHMEIESANGKDLEGYGNNSESEILFARGSNFVTDRIEYDAAGMPTIYLTEVANEASTVNRGRNQEALSSDNRGQQEASAEAHKSEVQRLPAQNIQDGAMQPVSGRHPEGNLPESGRVSGVQGEITPSETVQQDAYMNLAAKAEENSVAEDVQEQSREYLERKSDRPNRRRAILEGEMVNEFHNALSAEEWHRYYDRIIDGKYNPDLFEDNDLATVTVGSKLLLVQMQSNGEFSVKAVWAYQDVLPPEDVIKEMTDYYAARNYGQDEIISWISRIIGYDGQKLFLPYNRHSGQYNSAVQQSPAGSENANGLLTETGGNGKRILEIPAGSDVAEDDTQNQQRTNTLNPQKVRASVSEAEDDLQYQSRDYLEEEFDDGGRVQNIPYQEQEMDRGDIRLSVDTGKNRTNGARGSGGKAFAELGKPEQERIVRIIRDHIYNGTNFYEARQFVAHYVGKTAGEMNKYDWDNAYTIVSEMLYNDIQTQHPVVVENRYAFLTEKISELIREVTSKPENQFQQRTNTLTDREVLAMAASEVRVDDLTADEKAALDIIEKRLSKLETLQTERAELGRLYKEQQFGAKVDRAAAAETLNRMRILDGQIQKASEEVLSVEEKAVARSVLQKARAVVEQQERQRGQEILKRWRDRRDNGAAIKKYRNRIRADVDELTNWVLHPDNKSVVKHIPDALKNTVISFLSSINFVSKRQLKGGSATAADKVFMERLRKLEKVMDSTTGADEMYEGYTDLPPDFMNNLHRLISTAQEIIENTNGEFVINQMTAGELQELSKVVRILKKYIMQMNSFHVNAMFRHVYEAGENAIDFLTQMKPAENTGGVSQLLLWQQMRPAYAFERFGEGGKAIYDGLRRGQAALAFNTKKIQTFAEETYTTAEVKAWEDQVKTIRISPGKTVTMRVSQIMSLYELNKREQARNHILGEGIRVATFKKGKQTVSDAGQHLTPGELERILQELTPRQREVADRLQQFMQKQGGEWGNYVTVARFGEKQFGEENYFPINSDGRHLSVDAEEKPGAAALYALLNMGFTKQTQEKAKNRIVVYSIFDVFANHMASVAQYNAFALPVVDALKWFNYRRIHTDEEGGRTILGSVREAMDKTYGVPEENRPGGGRRGYAQNFVMGIIKALNGTEAQGTAYESWGLQALHHYNRAQIAYNFRVVVQQPLAITRAALLLDYSSILKGIKLAPAAIRNNIREMQQYSGIAAWKGLGFYDVNISRGLTSIIKHDDTVLDKISDVGMWGAEKADLWAWAVIWSASKEEVIRKQNLTPKSEGFYEAVTNLFEDVIYKTQVVDSVLTKNEFMRDKGFFARAVGSFMSEPTTTASMLVDAYDKYHMDMQSGLTRQQAWKKNGHMIVRTAYVYGLSALILAAVQAAVDAFRDDDDYQEWYEKWLEAFGGNVADELMPLNKLPIVSDFYELAKELLSVMGVDTYGNPPQSVFMQWYDSLVKGVEILYDKISGENTNYTWYGGAYKLLQAASGMTGLPMASATREIITAWNNIVGAMAPSLKVKTYEPSEKSQIKYAYQDGYLTEEEAIEQLLKQGIAKNEKEARKIVQGWDTK